ncbi:MAG: glycosyltransferase, partial [Polyangiaceae bacterium]
MRVLTIANIVPRKLGSYEQFVIDFSRGLTSGGDESLIAFVGPPLDLVGAELAAAGAELLPPIPPSALPLRDGMRLVRRVRPAVVHVHFASIFSPIAAALRACGARHVIFTDHASGGFVRRGWLEPVRQAKNRLASASASGILAVSDFVRRRLVALGAPAARVRRIYNGCRVGGAPSRAAAAGGSSGETMLVAISQLIAAKGVDVLLRALARVAAEGLPFRCRIAGDGPLRAALEAQRDALGLRERVEFLGLVSEVRPLLAAGDIFVSVPRWEEAFGLAVAEAMAMGLPAVVSRRAPGA